MAGSIERAMEAALLEAKLAAQAGEAPVGAAVLCGEEIVALAGNAREASCDPTAHAEVLALRRAAKQLGRRRLSGCTLVVTLEPCPMCAGAALLAEVDRIVFGAYDPAKGCAGSVYCLPEDPLLGKIPCLGGVREAECAALMTDFFRERRGEAQKRMRTLDAERGREYNNDLSI